MNVKILPVFHQAVDERLIFPAFSADEVARYCILYGVNASIPEKRVITRDGRTFVASRSGDGVLLEHELGIYDPQLQARGFQETSCYVHVWKNRLHEAVDYLCVSQYDIVWTPLASEIIRKIAASNRVEHIVFGNLLAPFMEAPGRFHRLAFADRFDYGFLFASYNRFFGRNHDQTMLIDKPLTLWQNYLMPRREFEAMAAWLSVLCDEVYPWAVEPPFETHWGRLGGYTERAEALFMAARLAEGGIELRPLPIVHDFNIRNTLDVHVGHYSERDCRK